MPLYRTLTASEELCLWCHTWYTPLKTTPRAKRPTLCGTFKVKNADTTCQLRNELKAATYSQDPVRTVALSLTAIQDNSKRA